MEVKDIVKDAVVVSEETTFRDALAAMLNGKTNTLLVADEEGKLSGEVTVADLFDAIVPDYLDGDAIAANFATEEMFAEAVKNAEGQEVRFFMSQDYNAVELDDGLMTVATTAIAHQRARIPVVDKENRPVGIISRQGLKHILAKFLGIENKA